MLHRVALCMRPPRMAEALETQEQFPVQAGIQGWCANVLYKISDA